MKVCIVSAYAYYFFSNGKRGRVGGAELDLYYVGKYLVRQSGFDVSFVVADFGQNRVEKHEGMTILQSFQLKPTFLNYLISPFQLFFSLILANADVYVCAPAGPETGLVFFFCKVFRRKFIYRTAHDIDCNREYVQKNGFFGWLYERGLLGADAIFTSVKNHEDILHKTYGDRLKNIFFVPYGLEMPETVNKEPDSFVLWVARGEKWKNPKLFLDLAESFPENSFVMIMPKKAEESEFHDLIVSRANAIPNVKFIEQVPFPEIQPYFNRAKIFVNTSEYEGFTFTLLQSGIGETPVAYYKVNPDNIIKDHSLGYCADGDFEKLKSSVGSLLNNENTWKEKSQNIGRYIRECHSITKNIHIWTDLLRKKFQK